MPKGHIQSLKDITTRDAQAYIDARTQDGLTRQTLHGYAMALTLLPNVQAITLPSPEKGKRKSSRAYTAEQIQCIQAQLSTRYQLAVQILWESGCRVQDLASLRLASESPLRKARHHALDPARFTGREHWIKIKYQGKGGHEYLSTISPNTVYVLETYRLKTPREFRERGQAHAICQQYYALPVGQHLSRVFTQAAYNALGWSHGAHGLRHTYAQTRLKECLDQGIPLSRAKRWVSQSLGHYRPQILNVYLR